MSHAARGPSAGSADAEPSLGFNDVFSLRKPKDARAGLASGLKSVGKGVAGGLVGLVAAPVIGASQEGVLGFAKGLATGGPCAAVSPAQTAAAKPRSIHRDG